MRRVARLLSLLPRPVECLTVSVVTLLMVAFFDSAASRPTGYERTHREQVLWGTLWAFFVVSAVATAGSRCWYWWRFKRERSRKLDI